MHEIRALMVVVGGLWCETRANRGVEGFAEDAWRQGRVNMGERQSCWMFQNWQDINSGYKRQVFSEKACVRGFAKNIERVAKSGETALLIGLVCTSQHLAVRF